MVARSILGFSLLALTTLTTLPAWASEFAVELPPQSSKEAAEAMLPKGAVTGAHVVRRYVKSTGWSYLVVVDGLSDLDAARKAAGQLATPDEPATIYKKDGKEVREVEVVSTPVLAKDSEADKDRARRKRGSDDGAEQVLDAAVRAHGGRGAGLEQLTSAAALRFAYTRKVPADGAEIVADNVYVRKGTGVRLEVKITSGAGQDSLTVSAPDGKAWVYAGGALTDRDPGRVAELLERFSPETVLALPLGLPDDVETAEVWRDLRLVGTVVEDGGSRQLLEPSNKSGSGLVSAAFDPTDHTLRRVTWSAESGELTFRYDDYRRLDRHLVVPFHARVERDGALIEEVHIRELSLEPVLEATLFDAPGNPG